MPVTLNKLDVISTRPRRRVCDRIARTINITQTKEETLVSLPFLTRREFLRLLLLHLHRLASLRFLLLFSASSRFHHFPVDPFFFLPNVKRCRTVAGPERLKNERRPTGYLFSERHGPFIIIIKICSRKTRIAVIVSTLNNVY